MNVKKNLIFQTIYQIIALGIPLVLSPYLSRVLGADAIGVYTYTYSIAYYFVLLANLGIQKYGIRLIAQSKDDKEKLGRSFWSLYFVHGCFSFVSIISFVIFCLCQVVDSQIYWIQLLLVASALTDITWLFYGIEHFLSVILRNLTIKILEISLIFIFVKTPNDLWIYTLILASSVFVANTIMIPSAIKRVPFHKFSLADTKKHLKPLAVLFLSTVAVSVYTMVDKTILGSLDSKQSVAFYEYSDKLVRVPLQITTIVGTVLLPRMSALFAEKDNKAIESNMSKSIFFLMFVSCAFAFGLASISADLIPIYYGDEFAICGDLIPWLSSIIVIIGVGDVFRTQYLIPAGKDGLFLISIVSSAVINLILDFSLIPFFGVYGAVIGTIAAEGIGMLLQFIFTVKKFNIWKTVLLSIPFIAIGLSMFFLVHYISTFFTNKIFAICTEVMVGAIFYLIVSLIYSSLVKQSILKMIFGRNKTKLDNQNCDLEKDNEINGLEEKK